MPVVGLGSIFFGGGGEGGGAGMEGIRTRPDAPMFCCARGRGSPSWRPSVLMQAPHDEEARPGTYRDFRSEDIYMSISIPFISVRVSLPPV